MCLTTTLHKPRAGEIKVLLQSYTSRYQTVRLPGGSKAFALCCGCCNISGCCVTSLFRRKSKSKGWLLQNHGVSTSCTSPCDWNPWPHCTGVRGWACLPCPTWASPAWVSPPPLRSTHGHEGLQRFGGATSSSHSGLVCCILGSSTWQGRGMEPRPKWEQKG